MTKATKRFFTVMSILLLASVLLLPIYDEGGGMLTTDAEYNFARIIGDCIMKDGALGLWVVHMTAGIFLPSAVMLACAITGMRFYYSVFNTLGILVWFVNFFRLAFDRGLIHLFDVEKTDISIGAWLALLFFLISALVLLCTSKKKKNDDFVNGRCPRCGIKVRGNLLRCPHCGKKLTSLRKEKE